MTLAPRIEPGGLRQIGLLNWIICKVAARVSGVHRVHLFDTLARQRGLFRGWLHMSSRIMPGGTLPRQDTELVILRVAMRRACQYELDHHARIASRAGIDDAMMAQAQVGPSHPAWSPRARALLSAVDSLVDSKNVDDALWQVLLGHYSQAQLVELCMLVGQYEMLATTIATLRIPRDYQSTFPSLAP